jgi:hypothetical protein
VARDGKRGLEGSLVHRVVEIERFLKNTVGKNPIQLSIEILLGKFLNKGYSQEQKQFI